MQFCDHKRSSRHCGFYSPQVSSLDDSHDMREVDREGEEEDEYVRCDSDDTIQMTRATRHVTRVPAPLARILDRHVSTCPVLVSHLLASHYSTRHHGSSEGCSDCAQFAASLSPGLEGVLAATNRLQWSSSLRAQSYPVKRERDRSICCIQYFATFSLFIPLIIIIVLLLKLFNVIP